MPPRKGRHYAFGYLLLVNVPLGTQKSHFALISFAFGAELAAIHCSQPIPDVGDINLIHISEPTRLGMISYAVFCLKKKKKHYKHIRTHNTPHQIIYRLLLEK